MRRFILMLILAIAIVGLAGCELPAATAPAPETAPAPAPEPAVVPPEPAPVGDSAGGVVESPIEEMEYGEVRDCVDSDLGMNTREKGTTVDRRGEPKSDECVDDSTVTEYYCLGGQMASRNKACGFNKMCSDGACVTADAPPKECTTDDYRCTSDGSKVQLCNKLNKWEDVQACENGCSMGACVTDSCDTADEKRCDPSGEYVQNCRGKDLKWESVEVCDNGCSEGACA